MADFRFFSGVIYNVDITPEKESKIGSKEPENRQNLIKLIGQGCKTALHCCENKHVLDKFLEQPMRNPMHRYATFLLIGSLAAATLVNALTNPSEMFGGTVDFQRSHRASRFIA